MLVAHFLPNQSFRCTSPLLAKKVLSLESLRSTKKCILHFLLYFTPLRNRLGPVVQIPTIKFDQTSLMTNDNKHLS